MSKKYIIISIFLVISAVTACKKGEGGKESFEDFSSSVSDLKDLIISDEKPADQKKEKLDKTTEKKPEVKKEIKKLEEKALETQAIVAQPEKTETIAEEKKLTPLTADKKPYLSEFSTKYHLGYLAFDVANFYCELKSTSKDEYRVKFYSRSNGFVDKLFGWMSYTVSSFKVSGDDIIPQSFKTKVKLRKDIKEIELKYDANGKLTFENVTPPDNRAKRPAVPDNLKKNTFDPLTIGVEARKIVIDAFKNDLFNNYGLYKFNLPLYDGRRRSDIMFTLHKKMTDNNYKLSVQQKKIAGFTDNEMKDENRSEKAKIDIYVEPNNFVPMKIIGTSPIGKAEAKFTGNCEKGLDGCI